MTERDESQYRLLIRDMPAKERPRERLRDYGASYLSNAELIAILLRTGTSSENVIDLSNRLLLAKYGGLEGISKASFQELASIHGMGDAKTAQLKSALELSKRLLAASGDARPEVHSPEAVFTLLGAEMSLLEQEEFRVIALNIKNQVINVASLGSALFDPTNASSIMSTVPAERLGMAGAFVATGRQIGLSGGVALSGAILASREAHHLSNGLPQNEALVAGAGDTIVVSAVIALMGIAPFVLGKLRYLVRR